MFTADCISMVLSAVSWNTGDVDATVSSLDGVFPNTCPTVAADAPRQVANDVVAGFWVAFPLEPVAEIDGAEPSAWVHPLGRSLNCRLTLEARALSTVSDAELTVVVVLVLELLFLVSS